MEFLSILCNLDGKKIILASQSPRRIEILRSIGLKFEIIAPQFKEERLWTTDAIDYVRHNAAQKALWVSHRTDADLIIAADTVVTLRDRVFEKPRNRAQGRRMLQILSGKTHQVITGLSLITPNQEILDHEVTRVTFYPLSESEIESYLDTTEPLDKAGAYGIQGLASIFIKKVEGCYFNVVGFPLGKFYQHLKSLTI